MDPNLPVRTYLDIPHAPRKRGVVRVVIATAVIVALAVVLAVEIAGRRSEAAIATAPAVPATAGISRPTADDPQPVVPAEAAYVATVHRFIPEQVALLDDATIIAGGHELCDALDRNGGDFIALAVRLQGMHIPPRAAATTMTAAVLNLCPGYRSSYETTIGR